MSSNKASVNFRRFAIRSAIAIVAWSLTSLPARADTSCTPLIESIYNNSVNGNWYLFEMTMHRTDVKLVTYSQGSVGRNASSDPYWLLSGGSYQLFSDRQSWNQPFNFNAADQLSVWFSIDGRLYIYYSPWNYGTNWDMSCQGNVMTKYIPGHGVVTVTFREIFSPVG